MEKLTVGEVYDYIDTIVHFDTQEKWDNSGLLAGCRDNDVTGIYCALDVSMKAVEDAIAQGCNLIVSHHPIMFGGRKNLREDNPEAKMLCRIVRAGMSVISAHTCYDKAEGGVNDILAEKLGMTNVTKLEGDEEGYCRIGDIAPVTLKQFAGTVKIVLGDAVRAYGDADKLISRVAIVGGAGGEFAAMCQSAGADAYVTGEMRYHDSFDLAQTGFATLQAGHDATEKLAMGALAQKLKDKYNVPVIESNVDVFSIHNI